MIGQLIRVRRDLEANDHLPPSKCWYSSREAGFWTEPSSLELEGSHDWELVGGVFIETVGPRLIWGLHGYLPRESLIRGVGAELAQSSDVGKIADLRLEESLGLVAYQGFLGHRSAVLTVEGLRVDTVFADAIQGLKVGLSGDLLSYIEVRREASDRSPLSTLKKAFRRW